MKKKLGLSISDLVKTTAITAALFAGAAIAADAPKPPPLVVKDDGSFMTPSFELPYSSFASPEARDLFVKRQHAPHSNLTDIAQIRKATDASIAGALKLAGTLYPYSATKSTMAGVPVETFVPAAGIARENTGRILIELHGGAFMSGGGGPGGALESIPVAGLGRIKVVAVDYRQGPENHFPAASEDVASVYKELLKTYKPENIGIYGCSAGGMLTGQSMAWFLKEKLPMPGAIGVFCASLHTFQEGDSAQLWTRMGSVVPRVPPPKPDAVYGSDIPYLTGASVKDPLAVPSASKDVLKAFPPTLFLTGTRAPEMSGAAMSHVELLELGVKSELVLFDGMDHGFYTFPSSPESKRAYAIITRFFAENLGKKASKN